MFDFNCSNVTNLKSTCRGCLKISDNVRLMTPDEENTYKQFVKESSIICNLYTCVYCGYLIRKLRKFIVQCQEVDQMINNFLEKDSNSQINIPPLQLSHNFSTTKPQTLDVLENTDEYPALVEDDTVFDDEDIPLVMLKKEEKGRVKKKKKKEKNKSYEVEQNQENTVAIKTEDQNTDDSQTQVFESKVKCKKKPKKEVREGFSSRMVQEREEYVVIKLSKEQVLQEMEEKAKSEAYQRTLFKCHSCVKGFNFEDVLRTHMEKHSMENGSVQCDICTQYCPSAVSLRGHMKSHTTRCKICGCVRQSRQHLIEHHATAHTHGGLRYTCRQCDFCTSNRTSMQRHVKTHRAAERHACHLCGKLFKSLETLRVHTMRHDKSSRLRCGSCARSFTYPSLLHAHEQAVHVRNDYYCVECDKDFKSRENLRLHFKKAKKHRDVSSYQYECSQCPERFPSPSALSSHVTSSHVTSSLMTSPPGDKRAGCGRRVPGRDGLSQGRSKHVASSDRKGVVSKKMDDTLLPEIHQPTLLES